jgi:hypothetical protein
VPIDITEPLSDGWWMNRLSVKLRAQAKHCDAMHERYCGNPPLPNVAPGARQAVREFIKKASTNYERLIVRAVLSKLRIIGIRTPNEADADGDQAQWARWIAAGMPLVVNEVHKMVLSMSQGLVIVGKKADGTLLVTAEDPRQVVAETDPTDPTKTIAALKLYHDDVHDLDLAFLYMPGRVRVATHHRKAKPTRDGKAVSVSFIASQFDWSDDLSGDLPAGLEDLVAVESFLNEDEMAEFEPHLSILDRMVQQILQRMTVITFQAFKQRAIKGLPEKDPNTGEDIDYTDVFSAEPNAIWQVPAVVEFWESQNVDLTPILSAEKSDKVDLAAVSFTPLYSITPDAANGSAEGASLQRESHTFNVESHQDRLMSRWGSVAAMMAMVDGDPAVATKPQIIWAPAERFSLAERGSAAAQVKGVVPTETIWTEVMQYPPEMIARLKTQRADDMVLAEQLAIASAPAATPIAQQAAPPPAPVNVNTG